MLIFYSRAIGQDDVPAKSPVNESVTNALNIFSSLDPQCGFIGIVLRNPMVLQMMMRKRAIQIATVMLFDMNFINAEAGVSVTR